MSELVPSEIINKLEQRHEKLIEELDQLNERLEKALNSFVKPTDQADSESKPVEVQAEAQPAQTPSQRDETAATS